MADDDEDDVVGSGDTRAWPIARGAGGELLGSGCSPGDGTPPPEPTDAEEEEDDETEGAAGTGGGTTADS